MVPKIPRRLEEGSRAGLDVGTSDKLWSIIESRFIYTKDHSFIPLTAGIRINISQPYKK